ncbi:hypothetical protein [Slackia heliotrinireducens]|uniref:hypothetical protein n=1 Tax=Slackia heliotrinireducens TaxID=84110 RepID=UPI003315723E
MQVTGMGSFRKLQNRMRRKGTAALELLKRPHAPSCRQTVKAAPWKIPRKQKSQQEHIRLAHLKA